MPEAPLISKYRSIRATIEQEIRRGKYAPSERLPTEKEIAASFGVSYMTARRAITELVELDILVRRPGAGIFVRSLDSTHFTKIRVNIICRSDDTGSLSRTVERFAFQACAEKGWRAHAVHYQTDYYRNIERALGGSDPAIILIGEPELRGSVHKAICRASDRVVLLGSRLNDEGIASVMANDEMGIRLAVDYFKSLGHSQIGLVTVGPVSGVSLTEVNAWRSCFVDVDSKDIDRRLIHVQLSGNVDSGEQVYNAVVGRLSAKVDLENDAITALIVLQEDIVHAVLAACRNCGKPVPEALSMICYGGGRDLDYAYPPISSVDVNLIGHLTAATSMLTALMAGDLPRTQRTHTIIPTLVHRKSTA